MSKTLVAYFSASGTTKKIAEDLAKNENADLYEITPAEPYTAEDLNWKDENARSTVEMKDVGCRPELAGEPLDISSYDVIFVGFPIWWNREPSIVDSFLDAHDFTGKTLIPFCTSGGSGIGFTGERIANLLGDKTTVVVGKRFGGEVSPADLKTWTDGL